MNTIASRIGRYAYYASWLKEESIAREGKHLYPLTICLEGPDKTGKTTTIDFMHQSFDSFGIKNRVIKMPYSEAIRNSVLHDIKLTHFERTLLFLQELPYVKKIAHESTADVILMDRNPIFSIEAYTWHLLTQPQQAVVSSIMKAQCDTFLIPDVTFAFVHKPLEKDDTYAANVDNLEAIRARYRNMSHAVGKIRENMSNFYVNPIGNDWIYKNTLNDVSAPIRIDAELRESPGKIKPTLLLALEILEATFLTLYQDGKLISGRQIQTYA